MSTVERPEPKILLPLIDGQALDQPKFHERYAAMPRGTWAELVGGVVYMASPVRSEHGGLDHSLAYWIMTYRHRTRGLASSANGTVKLSPDCEVQPDCHLRIRQENGGLSRVEGGHVIGPTELVIEIGLTSRTYDLGTKKADYEATGVLEFLFIGLEPHEIHWFRSVDGRFESLNPGPDGIYRSQVFPGLWLDPVALFAEDLEQIIVTLNQGLASPEHQEFVGRLAVRKNACDPG